MTLYEYIASNNPYKANDLLSGYGFEESDSISTIASRLKLLVRKYKKIALKELYSIHPDKILFNSFGETKSFDESFVNATGRTPEFADPTSFQEPVYEQPSNFVEKNQLEKVKNIQKDAIREMNRVKRAIINQKRRRRRNAPIQAGMGAQFDTNTLLMLGLVFAVGYMIGKK